jgi:hypothetical protein
MARASAHTVNYLGRVVFVGTMLNRRNDETSFMSPLSSIGSRISCHVLNASLFKTGSADLGYITTSDLFTGKSKTFAAPYLYFHLF